MVGKFSLYNATKFNTIVNFFQVCRKLIRDIYMGVDLSAFKRKKILQKFDGISPA